MNKNTIQNLEAIEVVMIIDQDQDHIVEEGKHFFIPFLILY